MTWQTIGLTLATVIALAAITLMASAYLDHRWHRIRRKDTPNQEGQQ